MAECNGTAAGVDLGMVQAKVLQTVDGHGSEGLVDLVDIDVILVQVELGEELGDGSGRADTHDARGNASNGGTTELSQDRLVKFDSPRATHEEDSGSFIILASNHSIEHEWNSPPSVTWLELPPVLRLPNLGKAGRILPRDSAVVP